MLRFGLLALLALTVPAAAAGDAVCVENATISDLQDALAAGRVSAVDLVRAYLARVQAYDRAGVSLNAVREINPDAIAIAAALDAGKSRNRRPLEGIPILLKDNIATGDAEHTTAGSLALANVRARRDAALVRLLREAGAVILGKTNLREWANIRCPSSARADRARARRWRSRPPLRPPPSAARPRDPCSRRPTRMASSL